MSGHQVSRPPVTGFCFRCGTRLAAPPPTGCPACAYQMYVNPRPTAGVVILAGDRFLALRRVREPAAGGWDLPGGFCGGWEHPRAAAVREVREELGVELTLGQFIGWYVGSYRHQDEDLPVLDCFWFGSVADQAIRLDPAEASELAWLPVDRPPAMAFPTQDLALRDAAALRA